MFDVGYKMWRHIAHTLQSRSQAIQTTLNQYNKSAKALSPPCPPLQWAEVVEYMLLADVDLLCDTHHGEDIRSCQWATPASCRAMDMYFRVLQAGEEIQQLDVKILRFVTYMQDEVNFFLQEEAHVCTYDPVLACQIRLLTIEKSCYNAVHMDLFYKTSKISGFSAKITSGIHVSEVSANGASTPPTASKTVGIGITHDNVAPAHHLAVNLLDLSLEDKEYKEEETAKQELEDIYEVFSCALDI
jgi:hypothetical protein